MGFVKPANGVIFADEKIENSFNNLPDNDIIKKAINRTIENLKENIFCGKNISKKLIPKEYIQKYEIENLWRYPLPNGWRLVYSVITPSNNKLLAMIIEYFSHPDYEKKGNY